MFDTPEYSRGATYALGDPRSDFAQLRFVWTRTGFLKAQLSTGTGPALLEQHARMRRLLQAVGEGGEERGGGIVVAQFPRHRAGQALALDVVGLVQQ